MKRGHYEEQLARAASVAAGVPVERMAEVLYSEWYAPARAGRAPRLSPAVALAHYRAADASGRRFSAGWEQAGMEQGKMVVRRGEEVRRVDAVDYCAAGGWVADRWDSTDLAGWWATFVRPAPQGDAAVRVYWAVDPAGVFAATAAITEGIPEGMRYAFKCPLELGRCLRPDGVVLYVARADWDRLAPCLPRIYHALKGRIHATHPAFTLPLAPGVSLAEDVMGESFGGQRCRWLAEAFAGQTGEGAMVEAGAAMLERQGVRLEAPYRGADSEKEYGW